MMDGVRTVASPELSEDAVEAARARRRRSNVDERGVEEELGAAKVPSNHPWASSKQKLTKEVRGCVTRLRICEALTRNAPQEEDAKREKVMKLNRSRPRGSDD